MVAVSVAAVAEGKKSKENNGRHSNLTATLTSTKILLHICWFQSELYLTTSYHAFNNVEHVAVYALSLF